jgi:3-dehydroquinate dehydratase II
MLRVLVVNGPNLDRLGSREPEIYGTQTLADLQAYVKAEADRLDVHIVFFQSNSEQELIEFIETESPKADGLILNAGILTHYSEPLRDILVSAGIRTIEVHISNIHGREEFRRKSVIATVCVGQIAGLGFLGYCLALRWFADQARQ